LLSSIIPRKEPVMPDVPAIQEFGSLTATAVLGWYAWHTATVTIPNLVAAFRDEMAKARAECGAERELLYAELSAQRTQQHTDHVQIVEALNGLARRRPDEERGVRRQSEFHAPQSDP